jgi:site-specific DNA-cytosine methylase
MKAISLFAGVGGFDLALTSNGADKICEDCWDDL